MADDRDENHPDSFGTFAENGFREPGPGADEDSSTSEVRIVGAHPPDDTVRGVDLSDGEEPRTAPASWRREHTDVASYEDLKQVDTERQAWHFESEDTLVIDPAAEPEAEREPELESAPQSESESESEPERTRAAPYDGELESVGGASPGLAIGGKRCRLSGEPAPAATDPDALLSQRPQRELGNAAAQESTAGTGGRDMPVAIGSGVLLGIIALLCFASGTVATMAVATLVVVLATAEAYAAFRRAHYHPATLLGLIAVLLLMVETYNKGAATLPLVLVLLVAGSFVWYLARVEPAAEPVSGLASTIFVFVWVGAFGSFAALLLNPNLFPNRHGIAFILAAVIVTVAADVAALLIGSALGRHPLAPSISPNKSWEGLIGGALAAILVSVVVVHFIHPWTIGKAFVFGVVVAIVAPLGDLSQSMIKRHLGLKDMGRLLPGHGGILDRIDGLLFVIPATYFVVKALHLG